MLILAAGEDREIFATHYHATQPVRAVVVLSSEMVTAAVLEGTLESGGRSAGPGQALVTTIEGNRTRRYGFDAARLAASLPAQWQGEAEADLLALADQQRQRAFWGLIEQVGTNATAPVSREVETLRRAYLGNPTVLGLRRAAGGDRARLASLTLQRFAEAVAASDAAAIADLIDPLPFSEAHPDPAVWQPARAAFARQLAADEALARALSAPATASSADAASFEVGGAFRVALVIRDRAMFVTAVEPLA